MKTLTSIPSPSFQTWEHLFCDTPECSTKEAFWNAIQTHRSSFDVKTDDFKQHLDKLGLRFPDATQLDIVEDTDGNTYKTHAFLMKHGQEVGLTKQINQCFPLRKHGQKQIQYYHLGEETPNTKSCEDIVNTLSERLAQRGFTDVSRRMEQLRENPTTGKVKSLHHESKRYDIQHNTLVKQYQTIQNHLKQPKQLHQNLLTYYQTALKNRLPTSPIAHLQGTFEIPKTKNTRALYGYVTEAPEEIALKSTGRPWEKLSCERIGGGFEKGFITDIEQRNLIAFPYDSETGTPLGRTIIRWGKDETGKLCVGIEPHVYSKETLNLYEKREFLTQLKQHVGDLIEYESCTTPYIYRGFSDALRKGNTSLTYTPFLIPTIEEEFLIADSPYGDGELAFYTADLGYDEIITLMNQNAWFGTQQDALETYLHSPRFEYYLQDWIIIPGFRFFTDNIRDKIKDEPEHVKKVLKNCKTAFQDLSIEDRLQFNLFETILQHPDAKTHPFWTKYTEDVFSILKKQPSNGQTFLTTLAKKDSSAVYPLQRGTFTTLPDYFNFLKTFQPNFKHFTSSIDISQPLMTHVTLSDAPFLTWEPPTEDTAHIKYMLCHRLETNPEKHHGYPFYHFTMTPFEFFQSKIRGQNDIFEIDDGQLYLYDHIIADTSPKNTDAQALQEMFIENIKDNTDESYTLFYE